MPEEPTTGGQRNRFYLVLKPAAVIAALSFLGYGAVKNPKSSVEQLTEDQQTLTENQNNLSKDFYYFRDKEFKEFKEALKDDMKEIKADLKSLLRRPR